jgi:hypothetical protein
MSELRRREAQHLASIDSDHCVEPCRMRLHHPPESSFGQFNDSIMDDEIEVGVEANALYRRNSWLP